MFKPLPPTPSQLQEWIKHEGELAAADARSVLFMNPNNDIQVGYSWGSSFFFGTWRRMKDNDDIALIVETTEGEFLQRFSF